MYQRGALVLYRKESKEKKRKYNTGLFIFCRLAEI